ncbi:ATP synthase F0 subunit B' [Acetobacter pasteurianus NBRC 101655]|nr:ATP synthase F0 subunit B' [Acetobacter pasteurianus]BAI00567.1 ATP synthase F0 B' chain [Acetobacter pasteurianus IFO 3283-01]BAI03616.1 ATP synthase F0 B' chain [Acetobacter pasteurianus IFO 3283-03]BAI06663.1 ATP synthase F0 B' chain [Acetobacter pasteurianus IFO 3283-07]BAI09711.1 ATP synthase F0 B' chain [Acetobacter pasteurianus IFO 3283-22]BAI12759.1 ATP synthase F0 B' chain [Acetobacter pasteurianus IFO 3283-26]BAI15805.1 ATP synthase F0 B' chain [Acetobacter pasteurianus IFO 3283-
MLRAGLLATVSGVSLLAVSAPGAYATGMPQLDFANPLVTGQVMWGAVIFFVFYMVLSKAMLPGITRVLEDRSKRISGDLEIARAAKQDADKAVAELQQARKDAMAEAQAHLDQVLAEEHKAAEQQMQEINARVTAEIADAEKRVAEEKTRALSALKEIAGDTTQALVQRLTGIVPDAQLVAQKVESASAHSTI